MTSDKADTEERATWWPITLTAAPRVGNIFWCKFNEPKLVPLPEMWKERPVVIIGNRNLTIKGSSLVAPISTGSQEDNKWAFKLPSYITDKIERRESWVISNHLVTISNSRLRQVGSGTLKLKDEDFNSMLKLCLDCLPKVRS